MSDLSPDRSLKLVSASISVLYLPTQRTENSLLSQILSSLGSKPETAADFAKRSSDPFRAVGREPPREQNGFAQQQLIADTRGERRPSISPGAPHVYSGQLPLPSCPGTVALLLALCPSFSPVSQFTFVLEAPILLCHFLTACPPPYTHRVSQKNKLFVITFLSSFSPWNHLKSPSFQVEKTDFLMPKFRALLCGFM